MKKKYFTPEIEEMDVETPVLLDTSAEQDTDHGCSEHTPACTSLFG